MTGFGKGEAFDNGRKVVIELKSVNNRYLEIATRLPKSLGFCDEWVRQAIQNTIKRGNVEVSFNYENSSSEAKKVTLDLPLAGEYVKAAKHLRTEYLLDYDFNTTALLRSPDVTRVEYAQDNPEQIAALVKDAAQKAVVALDTMRRVEGASIHKNLTELIKALVQTLKQIATRAPQIVSEYRQKIDGRMREILGEVTLDEVRLLNEVAFFADKIDVNEELSRLSSHVNQFLKILDSNEPQGRKLDFIAQEMNREINTIGSKSHDIPSPIM